MDAVVELMDNRVLTGADPETVNFASWDGGEVKVRTTVSGGWRGTWGSLEQFGEMNEHPGVRRVKVSTEIEMKAQGQDLTEGWELEAVADGSPPNVERPKWCRVIRVRGLFDDPLWMVYRPTRENLQRQADHLDKKSAKVEDRLYRTIDVLEWVFEVLRGISEFARVALERWADVVRNVYWLKGRRPDLEIPEVLEELEAAAKAYDLETLEELAERVDDNWGEPG